MHSRCGAFCASCFICGLRVEEVLTIHKKTESSKKLPKFHGVKSIGKRPSLQKQWHSRC
jgi:hypothetical protein